MAVTTLMPSKVLAEAHFLFPDKPAAAAPPTPKRKTAHWVRDVKDTRVPGKIDQPAFSSTRKAWSMGKPGV